MQSHITNIKSMFEDSLAKIHTEWESLKTVVENPGNSITMPDVKTLKVFQYKELSPKEKQMVKEDIHCKIEMSGLGMVGYPDGVSVDLYNYLYDNNKWFSDKVDHIVEQREKDEQKKQPVNKKVKRK
jgi:hypothetical protein